MNTRVLPLSSLRNGHVIAENIMANTAFPIIPDQTVTTDEIRKVLAAFNVGEVTVFAESITKDEQLADSTITTFSESYNQSVQLFKKEYLKWQGGGKVDVAVIRQLVFPLYFQLKKDRNWMANLHSLSTVHDYRFHHAIAVSLLSGAIAEKIGQDQGKIHQALTAGALIDCGMARINARLYDKKSKLSSEEFNEMKKHPIYSFRYIKEAPLLKPETKLAILQHHERLDGSGYPRRDKANKLLILSQILGAADTYHALVCERIHQSAASPFQALEMLRQDGFGKFNMQIIDALSRLIGGLTVGSNVQLSNGMAGKVMFIHPTVPFRPLVRLEENGEMLDLSTNSLIHIESILNG